MTELWEFSASELAALFRTREISPVDVVCALLDRIELLEPRIQAWEAIDRKAALATADRCEKQLAEGAEGTLLGVPFGVKDIIFTSGLPTTSGFPLFSNFLPDYDATVVANLKRAGAVVLGKTVTTQFAYSDPTRTRNPWNLKRTPGGSSSGSGAAVAARMVPAALGSQTGGSNLRPAAYCGVVGFKPSFGRISRHGLFPLSWTLDHPGIIVRTVEDAALFLQACAGTDPNDLQTQGLVPGDYAAAVSGAVKPPLLGLLVNTLDRAEPEMQAHIHDVAQRLESAGATVREVELPVDLTLMSAIHRVILASDVSSVHADLLASHAETYAPKIRSFAEVGQLIPAVVYVRAQRLRRRFRVQIDGLFHGLDALLLPAAPSVAPDLTTTGDMSFLSTWTLLGMPSISLPSGLNMEQLPFAIQLVAGRYCEETLLGAASWCEKVLGTMPAPEMLNG